MKLNLLYVQAPHIGYGRMGTEIAKQLHQMDVEVYDRLEGVENVETPTQESLRSARHLNVGANVGRANVVCWCTVPSHGEGWWKGQKSCILTMWEAMRMPESFRDSLPNYETAIVPSKHNFELFSEFHDNVKYVPLGIDPEAWSYKPRTDPTRFFRYLIGGTGKRKGTDLAVKAFNKVWGKEGSWGSGPIPVLQLKSPRSEDYLRADGRIEPITGHISPQEEIDLYAQAHCYLQPSRGEGFGMQPLQAIAQGLPTILTDGHGHEAFAHLGWPVGWTPKQSDYFIYGESGDWWEPNFDELCDQMVWIYDNYNDARQQAARSSMLARNTFNWRRTASGLLDALGRDRLTDYVGPDEWFEPEVLLFPVVLKRKRVFDIGTHRYAFEPGVEYWTFADVKRVLFEGGELDPSCLNDADPKNCGLAKSQVAKVGGYRAEFANCPTCHRPLGSA